MVTLNSRKRNQSELLSYPGIQLSGSAPKICARAKRAARFAPGLRCGDPATPTIELSLRSPPAPPCSLRWPALAPGRCNHLDEAISNNRRVSEGPLFPKSEPEPQRPGSRHFPLQSARHPNKEKTTGFIWRETQVEPLALRMSTCPHLKTFHPFAASLGAERLTGQWHLRSPQRFAQPRPWRRRGSGTDSPGTSWLPPRPAPARPGAS